MEREEWWEFTDRSPDGAQVRYRLEKRTDKAGAHFVLLRNSKHINDVAKQLKEPQVFRVLEYFLHSEGVLFERKDIRDALWPGKENYQLLETYLTRLRMLLKDSPGPRPPDKAEWGRVIITERGNGLRFGGTEIDRSDPSANSGAQPDDVENNQTRPSITRTSTSKPLVTMGSPLETPAERPYQGTLGAYVLEEQGLVIGREREIEIARERWLENRKRPLLIQGPAGIGKSTLALAVLQNDAVIDRFGSRRFRWRCDGLSTVTDLIARIGEKWFGLPLPITELQVTGKLSDGPSAVLLDNYETLLEGDESATSIDWLAKLLGIKDLWLMVGVRGRELPRGLNWADPVEPTALSLDDARRLYGDSSRRPEHLKDARLDELLGDMGGVPRAIELLAAQARNYPKLDSVLARWEVERSSMLRTGLGKSSADSLDESYNFAIGSSLLDDEDRKFLRILAFLPAGVAEADLESVMSGGLGASGALWGAALLYRQGNRVQMLPPLREYIAQDGRKASKEEKRQAQEYFLRLAMKGIELGHYAPGEVAAKLSDEYPNCTAVLRDALSDGHELAVHAANGLASFSTWSGIGITDSKKLARQAANLARLNRDKRGEAEGILSLAALARRQEDFAKAEELYKQSRQLFKESGGLRGEADCIYSLGIVAGLQNKFIKAEALYTEARSLFINIASALGETHCLLGLGEAAAGQGKFSNAERFYREALELYRHNGSHAGEANCILNLGVLACAQKRFGEAETLIREAQKLFKAIGNKRSEANCSLILGEFPLL